MSHSTAAVALDDEAASPVNGATAPAAAPVRAVAAVPHDLDAPAPTGCVTVSIDDDRACVVRLRGSLGRGAIARVDAVLQAVEPMADAVVIDLDRASTDDRRLLRVVADVAVRRREAGRRTTLRGMHPDVVPWLEEASLPEAFLVYEAVCR